MEVINFNYSVYQSQSIHDFIKEDKSGRIIGMPYWIKLNDGTMWFEYVGGHTNSDDLIELIKEGKVFIRAVDLRSSESQKALKDVS